MKRFLSKTLPLILLGSFFIFLVQYQTSCSKESMNNKHTAPSPKVPEGYQKATFGAGCYWCVEAVFEQLNGVHSVTSGFMGGNVQNPSYEAVCRGTTGHAEVVNIIFDPKKISYTTLLEWFWKVHNPTELNRQGNDIGTQYRSAIFYHNQDQKNAAIISKNIAQKNFSTPIVTELTKATKFYPATISHQDYYRINKKKNPYCRLIIRPKLEKLKLDK